MEPQRMRLGVGLGGQKNSFPSRGDHGTIIVRYAVHTELGTAMYTARKRDAAWWPGVASKAKG